MDSPVQGEQAGHDREGRSGEHGPGVVTACARDAQRDGGDGGREGREADGEHVQPGRELDRVPAEGELDRGGYRGRKSADAEQRKETLAKFVPHGSNVDSKPGSLEG
jgi:hypothetical protein